MKKLTTSLLLVTVFLVISACVTQKKKEDVGPLKKGYHNMTAHYNGYYNATVLLAEAKTDLEQQVQDNYRKILPIYKYVAAENPKAVAEKMDKAAAKVSVVVNMHRVSRWTDDCYLVLGQSQFFKQDYESAEESLEFMTAEFNPKEMEKKETKSKAAKKRKRDVMKGKVTNDGKDGEPKVELSAKEKKKLADKKRKEREKERKQKMKEAKKNRKKGKAPAKKKGEAKTDKKKDTPKEEPEEEATETALPAPGSITLGNLEPELVQTDPENYFMKHRPAYQEGVLWLARTYIERDNYTHAERLLNDLERSPATFPDVRREAAIAKAHFFLSQKKYDQAVEPLKNAISMVEDDLIKARLAFILGQIHQQAKRHQEAYDAYALVLKTKPPYEMDFAARLNSALSNPSKDAAVSQLERMLKDDKNKEFQDQIHFALASIALEKSDKKEGIKQLEMSLAKSSANISQKAESYLLLADLYFEEETYVKAKLYYDSTLMVMTSADERHRKVSGLAKNLEEIAMNLLTIQMQESLIAVSNMTEEDKLALATSIKKKKDQDRLDAAKQKAASQQGANAANLPKGGAAPALQKEPLKFWAYNDKDKKDGKRDFERKWGSRTLQDNWRRSDQTSIADGSEEIQAANETTQLTEDELKELLKDVPDSPEKLAAANRQIESSLFNLGVLFRDRLENYKKSVESLEKLLTRYPDTQYKLDALYYLYLSYKDMGDASNAQRYYDMIVNGYPTSNYARILKDPSFAENLKAKEDKLTTYYDETLQHFEQRKFQEAYDRIGKVGELFGGQNNLMPRFALLGAMCIGNLQGKEAYVAALKEVVAKFPSDPESTRAKEILRLLGENLGTGPGQQRDLPPGEGQVGEYKVTDDQLHYVIVVFQGEVVLNDAKIIVSDYNEKYHKAQKLRMNNIFLGEGNSKLPVIAIRRYTDKKEAMEYLDVVSKNSKDFLDASKYKFELFPISQDNYKELLKSKNLDDYRAFFEKNYLNK
ncbi:MAG: tetratricopeptide repeat protein [Saprospiraceae bacterium]|nr:tetratricopeptide repeat protein [Saprospiraceae bacterium]